MPQLDKVSYFTQFFWLTLTVTVLYVTLVKYYLPTISRTLKMRQHKMEVHTSSNPYEVEEKRVLQDREKVVRDSLTQARQALSKSFDNTATWVSDTVRQTNVSHFKTAGQNYQDHLRSELATQEVNQAQLKKILPFSAYGACGLVHHGQNSLTDYFLIKTLDYLLTKKSPKKQTERNALNTRKVRKMKNL